jgi:hypothetical protein
MLEAIHVGLNSSDNFVTFPLRPHKVVVVPLIEIAHRPPEATLYTGTYKHRVITLSYIILVRRERLLRKLNHDAIAQIYLV